MGLTDRLRALVLPPPMPYVDNLWPYANIGGLPYGLSLNQTLVGKEEGPPSGYAGLVGWAYESNAVVYAVEQVRIQLFAEA